MKKPKSAEPLAIRYVAPGNLRLNEKNPRLMPPEEMAALRRSLEKWGFVDPRWTCLDLVPLSILRSFGLPRFR